MKVMVIAVHPDDETLGCGGTLLRHKAENDEIYWLIVTNVFKGDDYDQTCVDKRKNQIDAVKRLYGFENTIQLDFPTTELDRVPINKLVKSISDAIHRIQPEVFYIPFHQDVHTDHQVSFKAILSSTKSFRYHSVRRILMYETLSETEFAPSLAGSAFLPNVFVDISNGFEMKSKIMQIYQDELMDSPYPRSLSSIKALANYRGSRIGVEYAEAFMLIHERIS
jgi:N-acetylglucosamine malate deacetylase 1